MVFQCVEGLSMFFSRCFHGCSWFSRVVHGFYWFEGGIRVFQQRVVCFYSFFSCFKPCPRCLGLYGAVIVVQGVEGLFTFSKSFSMGCLWFEGFFKGGFWF